VYENIAVKGWRYSIVELLHQGLSLAFLSVMTQPLPFHLTPEDLQILSMTDEEYTPLSWDFIKDVIGSPANYHPTQG
jgi:hypothetical protein